MGRGSRPEHHRHGPRARLDSANGVEGLHPRRAPTTSHRRARTGIQIGLLDVPIEQQRELFYKSIEEAGQLSTLIEQLLDSWKRGDEQSLREELAATFEPFPDLYRTLIVERNDRWLPQIDTLLRKPGDHLVIVGALHLIGEHSLISLLEQRGYRVRRL